MAKINLGKVRFEYGDFTPEQLAQLKGERGDKGEQGLPGKDGKNGVDGKSLEFNWNGTELGVKKEGQPSYSYVNLKGQDGRDGADGTNGKDGVTPNIAIGTITTLEAGQQATVVKRGTIENPIFDFGIPKGEKAEIPSDGLVTTEIIGSTLILTTDKYQKTTMEDNTTIVLPSINKFTEIHLFFTTTSELTLILPSCKWQGDVSIEANKTYEFIFTYIDDSWLGGCVVYV